MVHAQAGCATAAPASRASAELGPQRLTSTRPRLDASAARPTATDGLISGDRELDLTAAGESLYRDLREYISRPTIELLGQLDADDVETTVRTLQAITPRAAGASTPPPDRSTRHGADHAVAELRYRKDLFEGTAEYYDRFRPPLPG